MAKEQVERILTASPERVWAVLGNFGGIDAFFPGIQSCRVEGEVRILDMGGNTIKERLLDQDDEARRCSYSVIEMPGIEHRATISVEAAGSGSRVVWAFEVLPDSMAPVFEDSYVKALDALEAHLA